jgi:Zn-dependent protease with chaperone function
MSTHTCKSRVAPSRWLQSRISALIGLALFVPLPALSESFLICNQRPHSLESVTTRRPHLVLASSALTHSLPHVAPATFAAGCSYPPSALYVSLSAADAPRHAPAQLSHLVELLVSQSTLKLNIQKPLRVVITPDAAPNAYIRKGSELRITSGMLQHVTTAADAAFVVAHELAHVSLKHSRNASTTDEIAADSHAVSMVEQIGFPACSAPRLIASVLAANARPEGPSRRRVQALSERISTTCGDKQKFL